MNDDEITVILEMALEKDVDQDFLLARREREDLILLIFFEPDQVRSLLILDHRCLMIFG